MELRDRRKAIEALAAKVNAGRKPQFGEQVLNPWAGVGNPNRCGFFVEAKRRTGKLNPGLWYRLTDKRGNFWEIDGKSAMLVECLKTASCNLIELGLDDK